MDRRLLYFDILSAIGCGIMGVVYRPRAPWARLPVCVFNSCMDS